MTIAFHSLIGIKLLSPQLSVLDPELWRESDNWHGKVLFKCLHQDIYCWETIFEWKVYIVSLYNPY